MTGFVQPIAAWQVTLDGTDLTSKIKPRLVRLSLDEATGEQADKLEIVVSDHDGKMALPAEGAVLAVSLGWEKGTGVEIGLVSKGTFKVDEVEWSGPPDQIRVSAHSADFAGSFRKRKNRTWHGKTLGAIVAQLAADNGLTAACHADLASTIVTSAEQASKSDMQFLRDLGRRYDAVATVKAGSLIFSPVNATTTPAGSTIPTIAITRSSGDGISYRRAARENGQDGAEAQYYDQGTAKRHTATAGGSSRRRLKRVYASSADASAAATSESNRLARAAATFSLNLAYGNARLSAGARATVTGCKSEIDAKTWRIKSVRHSFDKSGGFRSQLELEAAGN